jgi:hypothetical protein
MESQQNSLNHEAENESKEEYNEEKNRLKKFSVLVLLVVLAVVIMLGIIMLIVFRTNNSIESKNINQNQETGNNERRYSDFPYFYQKGKKVVMDAKESEFVMQHPVIDKDQIYLDTPKYGQMPAINSKGLKLCSGLMRVEGKIDSISANPGGVAKSYEGQFLNLDKATCIENFIDPEDWYSFKVEGGSLIGHIINPFPGELEFEVDFFEEVLTEKYKLSPYEKIDFNIELDCDRFSFGDDQQEEASLSGRIIPGVDWDGPYSIFMQYLKVAFAAKECPTSPKISMESFVEPQDINLGDNFLATAKIRNSGYLPANNIKFSMNYNQDVIKPRQHINGDFSEVIDLDGGEEKEYAFVFETIKTGNNTVFFIMSHDSLKKPWSSFVHARTSNPLVQYDINVDAEEKNFVDGKAEFIIDFTNTGIPEYYKFTLIGSAYCDFIFSAKSDPAASWIRQKNFKQNESVSIKVIIYEEKLKEANMEVVDNFIRLEVFPQNDKSKIKSIYLNISE